MGALNPYINVTLYALFQVACEFVKIHIGRIGLHGHFANIYCILTVYCDSRAVRPTICHRDQHIC